MSSLKLRFYKEKISLSLSLILSLFHAAQQGVQISNFLCLKLSLQISLSSLLFMIYISILTSLPGEVFLDPPV